MVTKTTATKSKTPAKTPAKTPVKSSAKAPAKKPSTPRAKKIVGPTVAVFVDIENTNASRDNLIEVFTNLSNKATVTYGKFYGYRFDKAAEYDEIVAEHRLETVGRMRFKHGDDSVIDTRLVVDAILAAESRKYDFIFIWAGVGDLMTLFAHLKQLGSKVMTVDLPVFDTANKFVDQKVKLFSNHTLHKAAPVATTAPIIKPAFNQPIINQSTSIFNDRIIPALPRKIGAPELTKPIGGPDAFGAIADTEDDDAEGLDDENFDEDELDDDDFDDLGDDDLGDFDDLGDDDDDDDFDADEEEEQDEEEMNADENDKLFRLSMEMLRANREGKDFDVEMAAKELEVTRPEDDFAKLSDDDKADKKNTYFNAATQYDADSSAEAKQNFEKPATGGSDDFGDFGKI